MSEKSIVLTSAYDSSGHIDIVELKRFFDEVWLINIEIGIMSSYFAEESYYKEFHFGNKTT